MLFLFLGVFFFGLTHPVGKLFLDINLPIHLFCLLFLAFRLLVQVPIVAASGEFKLERRHWALLLVMGIVGATLHYSEFKALTLGLSVPVVSFLIFTHPIWTQTFQAIFNREQLTAANVAKLVLGVIGILLILGPEAMETKLSFELFIPLIASFAFSAWVLLSDKAQKQGVKTVTLSFYYDLISFLILLGITASTTDMAPLVNVIENMSLNVGFSLFAYSMFVGVLANYLFYVGVKKTSSMAAAFALLLEPIISTVIASILFKSQLGVLFYPGCALLIAVNLPKAFFTGLKTVVYRLTGKSTAPEAV